jgi:hypothetical protein
MGRFWREYHSDIIGVGVAVIIALGTSIWAIAKAWQAPLIVPLAVGTFALALFAINQWNILASRRQKRNLENYVVTLLYKLGLGVRRERAEPDQAFLLSVTIAKEGVTIWQPKDRTDYLSIAVDLAINEEQQKQLESITASPQSTLIEDLKISLAQLGVAYLGVQHPLRTIRIIAQVTSFNLHESGLLEAIELVRRGARLTAAIMLREQKRAGKIPKTQPWQHDTLAK